MTPDRLDALIRSNFPATKISSAQVDRVIGDVLARLTDGVPARLDTDGVPAHRWQTWLSVLGDITPSLPNLMRQSAIPVGVALALGLYTGQFLQPTTQNTTLASLMPASDVLLTGY